MASPERRFVFSVHKAASTQLYLIVVWLASTRSLPLNSANGKGANLTENWRFDDPDAFGDRTGLFGTLRFPWRPDFFDDSPAILHLRDPRDVLTSCYFSIAYSHVGYTDAQRQAVIDQGIDRFVQERIETFKIRYSRYVRFFLNRPNVTLLYYEDMIAAPERWAAQFAHGLFPDLDLVERLRIARGIDKILAKAEQKFTGEDPMKHVRKRLPGDHKVKLRAETIDLLDKEFSVEMAALGYARTQP